MEPRAQQANNMSQQTSPSASASSRNTLDDDPLNIYEDVFSEFNWDSCDGIIRIQEADVEDQYPNSMINLQWKNLSDPIRAALPCLHTLDLTALQSIDVVALEAFIICVSKAIEMCAPLKIRYKLINSELCDNLKKNIERFHPKDENEPTEGDIACGKQTMMITEKQRRILTPAEKAQDQIVQMLKEEGRLANKAARVRAQREKKQRVKQTTQRGVVRGIMSDAVKEKVTTTEESTMYHLSRGVSGVTSNIILDKFSTKKEVVAPVINPKYELLGCSSSISISEVVKQLDASSKESGIGSLVRGKKGFEFNFNPVRQSTGSSIFGIPAEQTQGSNRWEIAALRAMNSGRSNKYDRDSNRDRREPREYKEYSNVPETKWSRGSTNDADPAQATSMQESGWGRGSSNVDENKSKPRQRTFESSSSSSLPQPSGWSRGSTNDKQPEMVFSSRKQTSSSFERGSVNDRESAATSSSSVKKSEGRAAWPVEKIQPRTTKVQVQVENPNRWNVLDTTVEDVSANNSSDDDQ